MLQQLSKLTRDEQKKNEHALNQFRYSFLAGNFEQLEELLDDKSIYFKGMNKKRALAHFHKFLFSEQKIGNRLWPEFKDGFSMDEFPGEHVIEFRFMETDPFTHPDVDKFEFGDAPRKEFNELVIRLAFRFSDGKIVGLRFPKKVVKSIDLFMLQN
ncbi:MAG: hypothetical protein ACKOXP_06985 [Flavobacteriales bacterium]